jgi:hypothetical protein
LDVGGVIATNRAYRLQHRLVAWQGHAAASISGVRIINQVVGQIVAEICQRPVGAEVNPLCLAGGVHRRQCSNDQALNYHSFHEDDWMER